jgi:hypothetical protein
MLYLALPRGEYRAPTWALGRTAIVFAGSGKVWSWPLGSSGWGSPRSVALPHLVDATVSPDERDVMAVAGTGVHALDPETLVSRRFGSLRLELPYSDTTFDPSVPPLSASLRYTADGRAFASLMKWPDADVAGGHGAGWLSGCSRPYSDIATQPCFSDTGGEYLRSPRVSELGVSMVRSANGGALSLSYPFGGSDVMAGIALQRIRSEAGTPGVRIVAIDDKANWQINSQGFAAQLGMPIGFQLTAAVPVGWEPGGYGLAGDGSFALVYIYQVANEAAGPRARDARLLVVDLRSGIPALVPGPGTAAAGIPLQEAVGCTVVLEPGEVCRHMAHVVVAPGDRSAVVLGPRGIAVAPIPATPFSTNKFHGVTLTPVRRP